MHPNHWGMMVWSMNESLKLRHRICILTLVKRSNKTTTNLKKKIENGKSFKNPTQAEMKRLERKRQKTLKQYYIYENHLSWASFILWEKFQCFDFIIFSLFIRSLVYSFFCVVVVIVKLVVVLFCSCWLNALVFRYFFVVNIIVVVVRLPFCS